MRGRQGLEGPKGDEVSTSHVLLCFRVVLLSWAWTHNQKVTRDKTIVASGKALNLNCSDRKSRQVKWAPGNVGVLTIARWLNYHVFDRVGLALVGNQGSKATKERR